MDIKNIFETGKPHLKILAMIYHHFLKPYNTIRVSYEGFRIGLSLNSGNPCTPVRSAPPLCPGVGFGRIYIYVHGPGSWYLFSSDGPGS